MQQFCPFFCSIHIFQAFLSYHSKRIKGKRKTFVSDICAREKHRYRTRMATGRQNGDKSRKNFKVTFIIERPLLVKNYPKFLHVLAMFGGFVYVNLKWYLINRHYLIKETKRGGGFKGIKIFRL